MGIQDIENKILEDAQAEALKIKKSAEEQASLISQEFVNKAEEEYQNILKKAKLKAGALQKSIIVPARLEAKNSILAEKHKLVDEVFKGKNPKKREESLEKVANCLFS